MIDLHCHMLPAIDDGAPDLDTALAMARIAVDDGITTVACTPHIYPGLFENTAAGIEQATLALRQSLEDAGIPLEITFGADVQIVPELVEGLDSGRIPTLHGSRYFLFEPPHHIHPPRMDELIHDVLASGYVPVITHPERLTYIEKHYGQFADAARKGAWIQLTAGSLSGRFGKQVQKISERFIKDGITHLLASDAHNLNRRAPIMSDAREIAEKLLGAEEAQRLVYGRPRAILDNIPPESLLQPPGLAPDTGNAKKSKTGWLNRLLGRSA